MIKLPPSTNDTGTIVKMVPTRMNATTATSPFLAPSGETDKTLNLMSFRTEQSFQRFCARQDNYPARCYSGSDGKSVEKDCLRAEGEKAAKSEQKGSRRSGQKITLSSVFIAFDTSIFYLQPPLCSVLQGIFVSLQGSLFLRRRSLSVQKQLSPTGPQSAIVKKPTQVGAAKQTLYTLQCKLFMVLDITNFLHQPVLFIKHLEPHIC